MKGSSSLFALVVLGATSLALLASPSHPGALQAMTVPAGPSASAGVIFRFDQVGYPVGGAKRVLVMVRRRVRSRRFELLDAQGRAVLRAPASGPARWNRRYLVYALDFSTVRTAGVYTLRFAGASSQAVRVADPRTLYRSLADGAIAFLQSQRDGPEPIPGALGREPAHLNDASAAVYRTPRFRGTALAGGLRASGTRVNASGGWFDAGDYLKFVETASFVDVTLLYTAREDPGALTDLPALLAEARHGTDWLLRMWDQSRRVLYLQVGLGDGSSGQRIIGDHDLWRLPQADEAMGQRSGSPSYFIAHRPVFAANAPGAPISPNLAGRLAGAFGLCAQVFARSDLAYAQRCLLAGQLIYAQADTHPRGGLVTSAPFAYYPEREWRDDMQLGASELYLATSTLAGAEPPSLPHRQAVYYLPLAGRYANAYITASFSGHDSFNVYDTSALADSDLVRILRSGPARRQIQENGKINVPSDIPSLLSDRHDQLSLARRLAAHEPFGLANPAMPYDTVSHALGYIVQARLYDAMTHSHTFAHLAQNQLDWVLGANAWGSSFIVGAGSVFPHCLASQIPNLAGSLDGRPPILAGATVDGPAAVGQLRGLGAPSGYRRCSVGGDRFAAEVGHGLGYLDDVRSPLTSEPSDDLAALTLLAAAVSATPN
ncbi:MAG TPA: glycoside hydrolase family 9 protein [Solirubrobacteraceae bacterium]